MEALNANLTDRDRSMLTCADANYIRNGNQKYLSVTYLTCTRRIRDCIRDSLGLFICDDDFDLDLLKKVHRILSAPVMLRIPFLFT